MSGHVVLGAEFTRTTAFNQSTVCNHSNQIVILSATVTPVSNEGTIQFSLDRMDRSTGHLIPVANPVTSTTLSNGVASVPYLIGGDLVPGGYTIHAEYSGSSNFLPSHHVESILTVYPAGSQTLKRTNATELTIPEAGPASTYPSEITVNGAVGVITNVAISLNGLSHPYPGDLDILVIAPGGQRVALSSNAGGGHSMNNVDVTISDWAGFPIPFQYDVPEGTYLPTVYSRTVTNQFGIKPPFSTNLSSLNGLSPNGTWSLYVSDVEAPDAGVISGGWTLVVTTVVPRPALQILQSGASCLISFATISGVNYFVECKDSISDADWTLLKQLPGTGKTVAVPEINPGGPSRFYRVRVE